MGDLFKKNLQKGITTFDIPTDLHPSSIHRWRDSSYHNNTLAHYIGYYDNGNGLCSFFASMDEKEFLSFVNKTNSFGSTFLHDAVGKNNVKLLQYIFEGKEKEVILCLIMNT